MPIIAACGKGKAETATVDVPKTLNNSEPVAVIPDAFQGPTTHVPLVLQNFYGEFLNDHKEVTVIAEDVDGEALAGLIVNTARGTLKCCAVKAPGYGQTRTNQLENIACLTNGTVIYLKKPMKPDKFKAN